MRLSSGCINSRAARWALCLAMLIFLSGCATRPDTPIYNIRKDKIYDNQETIAILEVKVVDKTYSLESHMPYLVFDRKYPMFFVDQELQPLEWMMWSYWKTRDGANYFEAVCLLKARPGSYDLSSLVLEKQKISTFDSSHRVNVIVDKKWRFPGRRLVYLGEIQVEFTKRRIAADGSGSYQHHVAFNREAEDLAKILSLFKQEYPTLYTQYQNQLDILEPLP